MRVRDSFLAVILVVVCFVCAACTASREQAPPSSVQAPAVKTYVLRCQDGSSFPVQLEKDRAWIYLPMGALSVPRVPAISGTKYTDGKTSLWHRGKDALLQLGGKAYGVCVNNPGEVPWEEARLNGVDFRAVGDKLGWHLEITDNKNIVLETRSSRRRYEFPFTQPKTSEADFTTTYETKNGSQRLKVSIVALQCRDASTGRQFPATVSVNLDGKSYRGCGMPLE